MHLVRNCKPGQILGMGKARAKRDGRAAEAAGRRIEQLRHVFEAGYISLRDFERMKGDIEACIEPHSGVSGDALGR